VATGAAEPSSPEAITARWLTRVLRAGGALTGGRVTDVAVLPLGTGTGFMSVLARLRIGHERPGADAPASLIVKFPSRHAGAARMDAAFGHYRREFGFYTGIATQGGACAPMIHHAAFDARSGGFVIVMEDLAPATAADQLAGMSGDAAAAAIDAIAAFHARWWGVPVTGARAWLGDGAVRARTLEEQSRELWPAYEAFAGAALSAKARGVGAALVARVTELAARAAARPSTVIHGDFRADNLMFGAGPARIIDWQLTAWAPGAFDIAYLLTSSLDADARRATQQDLMARYHRRLVEHGVAGYTLADAIADYRLGALIGWCWPIVGAGMLDLSDARGAALFRVWAARMSAAVDDLDLAALVA